MKHVLVGVHTWSTAMAVLLKALASMVLSAVASERSSPVSLVLSKAYLPIEVTERAGDLFILVKGSVAESTRWGAPSPRLAGTPSTAELAQP